MNDGKIYITLSDRRSENLGSGGINDKERKPRARKTLPKQLKLDVGPDFDIGVKYIQHEMIHFAKQQASQFISYSIENIGNFTGNYQQQRDIQASLNILNMMSNTTMAGVSTMIMTGNPVFGAFASMVALGSQVINYDRQERANQFAIKRRNKEIEIMRDISGLNSLTNGNRIGD